MDARSVNRYFIRSLIGKAGLAGTYGGFKVELKSKVGSLDTAHLLFDETAGFSALMKTFDRNPQAKIAQRVGSPPVTQWTTRAPMLALTNPDPSLGFPSETALQPQILVRNTTAVAASVGTRFNWRSDAGAGSTSGPGLHLAPFETRRVDVAALQKSGVIPSEAHWASVELVISGQPDDIMAVAASYDSTLRYGTQTPFNDQLTYRWEGGEWHVDATHNSIITAGNGGTVPIKAQFTLYYDSGTKRYDLGQALKPHEQMWVDVGKLIREHTPDKIGAVLPPDLTMGSYEIQDLTDRGVGNLYEGKVIVDKTYGHAAYGCATCCGYSPSPWMYYDPIGVVLDATSTQDVWDRDNCTSEDVSVVDYFPDSEWASANHSIATVSGRVISGAGVGSTTVSSTGTLTIGNINSLQCPREPTNPGGPANVCNVPTKESTALASATSGVESEFIMTLSDAQGDSFDGDTITESAGNPGSDACYWSTNTIGLVQNPVINPTGSWTVAANGAGHNQYETDYLGFNNTTYPNYIYTYGPAQGVKIPCALTMYQNMSLACGQGVPPAIYTTNTLTITVNNSLTVTNCRVSFNKSCGTIAYPQ